MEEEQPQNISHRVEFIKEKVELCLTGFSIQSSLHLYPFIISSMKRKFHFCHSQVNSSYCSFTVTLLTLWSFFSLSFCGLRMTPVFMIVCNLSHLDSDLHYRWTMSVNMKAWKTLWVLESNIGNILCVVSYFFEFLWLNNAFLPPRILSLLMYSTLFWLMFLFYSAL